MPHSAELTSPAPPQKRAGRLALLVILCCLLGIAAWVFWLAILGRELGQDFMVFHTAARAFFGGDLALVYDGQRMTDYVNTNFPEWLTRPLPFHPYLYPPHFLLLLLPFGLLPFGISYGVFLVLTFAALLAATRCFLPRVDQQRLLLMALLIFPQMPFLLLAGQNSFLTAALLIAGFGLLEKNALLAGVLFGIASYKPQYWLMIPFALVAARQWQAIASAAVTAIVLTLASLAVFGTELWHEWIELMIAPSDAYQEWLIAGRLNGQSVYACAMWVGASMTVANIAQAIGATVAAASVFWSFRQRYPSDLKAAVLLAATLLAAPHVSSQDGIMLAVAAMFLLCRGLDDGFRPGDMLLIACVWFVEACDPPIIFKIGVATPLVLVWFILAVIARGAAMARSTPLQRLA